MYAYVGCYTSADRNGHGVGIATYQLDQATGAWQETHVLEGMTNPSFLAVDPRHRFLYCVHGGSGEGVSAFAISASGALTYLNTQPSGGINPVHLSIHPSGNWLVVANYTGATVAMLPLGPNGAVGSPTHVVPLSGQPGPDPVEQPGPHPHDIPLDPGGQFAVVPDKGLDRVFVFRLDTDQGKLVPTDQGSIQARPGAGPRHAAFHPHSPYLYVINELDSTVSAHHFDSDSGELIQLQVMPTLPADFTGRSTGAEIAVAPSGHYVYASNRGHDSIVIFAVDGQSGQLTPLGWEPTQGRQPRHFALDPAGHFLYAANQGSDTISTFRVDQTRGTLESTGHVVRTGSPVSIIFAGN